MSEISSIKIDVLNQEKYNKLISYIGKAGILKWGGSSIQPIYEIESIEDASGNPPFYKNIKIVILSTERKGDKEHIRKSLKGLIDLLD